MARTTRIEDQWAGPGANRQEGPLPIYSCNTCHGQVVWATSRRTGGKYLVNVRQGYLQQRFYAKHDLHDCYQPNKRGDGVDPALVAARIKENSE